MVVTRVTQNQWISAQMSASSGDGLIFPGAQECVCLALTQQRENTQRVNDPSYIYD